MLLNMRVRTAATLLVRQARTGELEVVVHRRARAKLLDRALERVLTVLVVVVAMPRREVMLWPTKLVAVIRARVEMSSGVSESPAREDTSTSRFKELARGDGALEHRVQSGSGSRAAVGWVWIALTRGGGIIAGRAMHVRRASSWCSWCARAPRLILSSRFPPAHT